MTPSVLIIGAGPTGLVLALWLTKLDVKVRIMDKTAEPGTTSRALAVQARTFELYRQLDLADFLYHPTAHSTGDHAICRVKRDRYGQRRSKEELDGH